VPTGDDVRTSLFELLARARGSSHSLPAADRNGALAAIAQGLLADADAILDANGEDVAAERGRGTALAQVDRLAVTSDRLNAIADAVSQVAALPDPVGRVLDGRTLASGARMRKVTVPFGVIGMIYESRPNVTVDAAVLGLKAGSAVVLRGSSNALASNRALAASMRASLTRVGLPADAVQLIDSPDRALVTELLRAHGRVDLVIPRGGAGLIRHVVDNARVPVIETGVGNCHVYVDEGADLDMAHAIVMNAKVQRPGVCNAAENLLVHAAVATPFLQRVLASLHAAGVQLVGCERTRAVSGSVGPATDLDFDTEFLDLKLAVRVVDSFGDALEHIARHGTKHSEAIVTRDLASAERFRQEVDAAVVFVNASTRFNDGFEFGLGAEIGISTQKLHARGPMGLAEMVTYKYLVDGDGQVRS
jgi:glutamate-5-semialdehyde dehydrogenase